MGRLGRTMPSNGSAGRTAPSELPNRLARCPAGVDEELRVSFYKRGTLAIPACPCYHWNRRPDSVRPDRPALNRRCLQRRACAPSGGVRPTVERLEEASVAPEVHRSPLATSDDPFQN